MRRFLITAEKAKFSFFSWKTTVSKVRTASYNVTPQERNLLVGFY